MLEPVDSEGEGEEVDEDECVKERDVAYHRYEALQELMRQLRQELDGSLAE